MYSFALGEQDNKLSLEHSNLRDGTVVRYLHIRQYLSSLPLTFSSGYLILGGGAHGSIFLIGDYA